MFYGCDMFNSSVCVIENSPRYSGQYECYEDIPAKVCIKFSKQENKNLETYTTKFQNCEDWCSIKYSGWKKENSIKTIINEVTDKYCIIR